MSPRAACRLERLGFEKVYDYIAGFADWKAAGLPVEGEGDRERWAIDANRSDVPTCGPDDQIAAVRDRTFDAGWNECVVVDCDNVVIGRLRKKAWDSSDDTLAADVMQSGPTTVRADEPLEPLVGRMAKHGTRLVVIATPEGHLLGVVLREEAEQLLAG